MEDYEDSKGELQRADHLLHVTLKYTRTSEVIKNVIKRLISAFDFATEEILEKAKAKKIIKEIPIAKTSRVELLEKIFKSKAIIDFTNFYFLLRKIDKSKHTSREEYRKHLTLIVEDFEVKVDTLKEYYEKAKEFVIFAKEYTKN